MIHHPGRDLVFITNIIRYLHTVLLLSRNIMIGGCPTSLGWCLPIGMNSQMIRIRMENAGWHGMTCTSPRSDGA